MKVTLNKSAKDKFEKDLQKKYDKESKKHPYTSNDSVADAEKKLKAQAKAVGAKPGQAAIKKEAKDIHKKLQGR